MKTVEEIKAEIAKIQKYQEECEALIDTSDNPAIERLNLAQIEGCEDKITSLKWVLGEEQHFDDVTTVGNADVSEFQVDWSQAPEDAFEWKMVGDNEAAWVSFHAGEFYLEDALNFNYQGAWQDSLRKRP